MSELLDFFHSVFNLKKQHIKRIPLALSIPTEIAIQQLKSGKYLLEDVSWTIDKIFFKNIVMDLSKLLEQKEEKAEQIEKLFSNIPDVIPTDPLKLIELLLKDKDITETEKSAVTYISWQSLNVFYQKTAESFKEMDYGEYWAKLICPVCGSLPKISRLNKENGKRIISCFLCWTEWPVSRISCVFFIFVCLFSFYLVSLLCLN